MLKLREIHKNYIVGQKDTISALKDINIEFEDKGFVSILGPSGCGKTTLLNIIGGLDHYTSGDLIIDGISTADFTDKDWDLYRNKRIGFVFQSYNLIPHLSVLENVEIPLILNGVKPKERKEKAFNALKSVGLENEVSKKPNQLSGGQMQRVAIARSLVNDPEIILADEPTGALDSKTSETVMEILSEISKTRLVIMVTHNKDLADKYSSRIISMFDGSIILDSENKNNVISKTNNEKNVGKTSMNFLTSLKMAIKNIFTKKGRVAMISVASSFGIIGVGLVLAISNGFSEYIGRVEEATASNAPITISSTAISYEQTESEFNYQRFPSDELINIYEPSVNSNVVKKIHKNEFSNEFLDYLDDINLIEKYEGVLASKLLNYSSPQYSIVSKNKYDDTYKFINSNTKVDSTLSMMAGMTSLPNTILHEIYGDQNYIENSYEVLKGTYPKNDLLIDDQGNKVFEISLVIDQYNRVDKSTLEELGLISNSFNEKTFSFDDILGTEFKFYLNDDLYYFNENNPDDQFDTATYRVIEEQNVAFNLPNSSLPINVKVPAHNFVQYFDYSKNQNILKKLYDGNYSLNKDGSIEKSEPITLRISSILRVKENSLLDYMPVSLCYTNGFKEYAFENNKNSNISKNIINNITILEDKVSDLEDILKNKLESDDQSSNFLSIFNKCFATFVPFTELSYLDDGRITGNVSGSYYVGGYGNSLKLIYGFGGSIGISDGLNELIKDFELNDAASVFIYLMNHPDEMISFFNYVSAYLNSSSLIESIILFPSTLNNKVLLKEYLDAYNNGKVDSEQIVYTDLIGTLTDGLGQMINIISIVLIVFASISLLVSCVMTGIITYNSVLERIKEIGVLRAVGARKKDVGRLFKSESIIIGIVSGLIGVIFTYIISIPVNVIVNSIFPDYNIGSIASLTWYAAIILIIISGLLAFVSGIIPARSAAKKDPVIALRSE